MPTNAFWPQPAILDATPTLGRFLEFDLNPGADPRSALARWTGSSRAVIGVGEPLVRVLGKEIEGLRSFPGSTLFPSTQAALWIFLGAENPSDLFDMTKIAMTNFGDHFTLREEVSTFKYREGRDLTGFEDGTENPKDDNASDAAIRPDGSSFVATQKYIHNLRAFGALSSQARSNVIGRDLETNEELPKAPPAAHVKRTAQESFTPNAFVVRKSMPWGGATDRGLYFCAYGESLDRFERILYRMSGEEDGLRDALLSWTRAVSGGYYWCPPVRGAKLDWSALGI